LVAIVVVLATLAGGYGVFRAVSPSSRQVFFTFQEQTPCPFQLGADLVGVKTVRCGWLTVPEDWSQPQEASIRLAVAIFTASSSHPAPDPVLLLGGGPGGAVLQTVGRAHLSNRDLILLDQRGTGYSQPSLRCLENEMPQACHSRLLKAGINLNAFTTLQNATDVHALIQALGYKQVNLYGVSYGTRLALTVMRLFPAALRSVVLDSTVSPQFNLFTGLAPAAGRAFDVLFQGCATDPHCNATYPHLQAVFSQLVTDLNTRPITLQATSQSGTALPVHFTGNDLVQWLRLSLYDPAFIPQLPAAIYQIRQHDYTGLASISGNGSDETMSWGMFYSVECSEDAPFTTPQAIKTSMQGLPPQAQPALLDLSLSLFSVCQFWGVKPVPIVQKEPVSSPIPTLILQGEYDPATPPMNGMLAAQTLSQSSFFLFPGVGHGVLASQASTCPAGITKAFAENPTEKPDASCIKSLQEPVFT
jgi:pimeloyl-ACP methyl ester carboxylesterase